MYKAIKHSFVQIMQRILSSNSFNNLMDLILVQYFTKFYLLNIHHTLMTLIWFAVMVFAVSWYL